MAQVSPRGGLYEALLERGMTRRAFLRFCGAAAAVLALPGAFAPRIAAALETAPRMPLVWLHGQACGGDTAAFLTSASPTTAELLLSLLSVDYQENLMAASGETATAALAAVAGGGAGYLAVVEGAIPLQANGMYCLVGGRPFVDVANEVARRALATIAVGACAVDGGVPGAHKGVSGAVGVGDLHVGSTLVNLPGCPVNVDNLAATVVHYLTFHTLPPMGSGQRPLFAYGGLIHNQCERRAHFEFGEFATQWGDAGAQQGWCLYKLGCKGPESYGNCPTKRFAEGTSWPVLAGHGCIGCTMPRFWDTMFSAYERLPGPIPFAPTITADQVGVGLIGGVAALATVHGAASYARAQLSARATVPPSVPSQPDGEAVEPHGEAVEPPDREGAHAGDALAAVQDLLQAPPAIAPDQPAGASVEVPDDEPAAGPIEELVERETEQPADTRDASHLEPETESDDEPATAPASDSAAAPLSVAPRMALLEKRAQPAPESADERGPDA